MSSGDGGRPFRPLAVHCPCAKNTTTLTFIVEGCQITPIGCIARTLLAVRSAFQDTYVLWRSVGGRKGFVNDIIFLIKGGSGDLRSARSLDLPLSGEVAT